MPAIPLAVVEQRETEIASERFMRIAIAEAKQSTEPLKCGAVIVLGGVVLAQSHNDQRQSKNASAHAEINALALAGRAVGSKNLIGCDIYCTCEPCVMCAAAVVYAKVARVFVGVSAHDIAPRSGRIVIGLDDVFFKASHRPEVVRNFLAGECALLYTDLKE